MLLSNFDLDTLVNNTNYTLFLQARCTVYSTIREMYILIMFVTVRFSESASSVETMVCDHQLVAEHERTHCCTAVAGKRSADL